MSESSNQESKDPMHGITLQVILQELIDKYGYDELAQMTNINNLEVKSRPTFKSTLKFLRKTPWARKKIEDIYIRDIKKQKLRNKLS